MIFFWDKNVPRRIPEALRLLRPPFNVEIYIERYPLSDRYPEGGDERWLRAAGEQEWFVITQDWRLHTRDNERRAIEDYGVGVFYLWGAEARKWEVTRTFACAYDRIVAWANTTPRPFICRVSHTGRLSEVSIRRESVSSG